MNSVVDSSIYTEKFVIDRTSSHPKNPPPSLNDARVRRSPFMLQSIDERAIPSLPTRPRRHKSGWPRLWYVLFLVRQQAQAGLFRDGGTIPGEVGDYVRQLHGEIEAEIAVRFRTQP
jgi:hypothetical protein